MWGRREVMPSITQDMALTGRQISCTSSQTCSLPNCGNQMCVGEAPGLRALFRQPHLSRTVVVTGRAAAE